MFLPGQKFHVSGLLLRPFRWHSMPNSLQNTLTRTKILFIHIQSFPFPLEYFGLHLPFKVFSECSFLWLIVRDTALVVLIVADLANGREAVRWHFCHTGCCLHVFCLQLFRHNTRMHIWSVVRYWIRWRSDLAAKCSHSESLRRIRVCESTVSVLDLAVIVFLKAVHLERDCVHFISFLLHDIAPVLQVILALPIAKAFNGVELVCQTVSPTSLRDLFLGLGHHLRLLENEMQKLDSQKTSENSTKLFIAILTTKCLLIRSSLS